MTPYQEQIKILLEELERWAVYCEESSPHLPINHLIRQLIGEYSKCAVERDRAAAKVLELISKHAQERKEYSELYDLHVKQRAELERTITDLKQAQSSTERRAHIAEETNNACKDSWNTPEY